MQVVPVCKLRLLYFTDPRIIGILHVVFPKKRLLTLEDKFPFKVDHRLQLSFDPFGSVCLFSYTQD